MIKRKDFEEDEKFKIINFEKAEYILLQMGSDFLQVESTSTFEDARNLGATINFIKVKNFR